ncbi:MAG: ATP-binding cassette domain-containing protein [Candidatus Thiodiazotropha sp.]
MELFERLHLGRNRRSIPIILQTEAAECGLACLAMCAAQYGYETDLRALRSRFSLSLKGLNLKILIDIASEMGLAGRALRLELDELSQLSMPCILHWDLRHFVVLTRIEKGRAIIHDPSIGKRRLTMDELGRSFTGIALELVPSADFKPKKEKTRVRLRDLLGNVVGLRRSLVQILLVSLALEVVAIMLPWLNQWIIDDVVVTGDYSLLLVLVSGMLLMTLFQLAISSLRSWLLVVMGTRMNLQWSTNVFSHLLRLPVSFFEKRHLGDVLSRFGAVDQIRSVITDSFIESIVDSIMALLALFVMLFYSVKLTLVVVVVAFLYVLLRAYLYHVYRSRKEEEIVRSAKLSSLTLESIRGVQSLKLFNFETSRVSNWLNQQVDVYNARIALQKLDIGFRFGQGFLVAAENSLVLWLAATMIINQEFTIGMLFAYLGYKEQFISKVTAFVDRVVSFRLLSIQTERLSDIVFHERDSTDEGISLIPTDSGLTIDFHDVWFRYADSEPWVLSGVNLSIKPGDSIVIIGLSGGGKTTLIKLMLGLLTPNKGDILVDGISLRQINLAQYRFHIGTVMQEDQLFAGSILENVAFFDSDLKTEEVMECLQRAGIYEEVKAMPMGMQTLVGDMGTTLSGGQKQRILVARALYKQPEILVLDEATSHLDKDNQAHVHAALRSTGKTHISITHREELLSPTDRVFILNEGQLLEKPSGAANHLMLPHDRLKVGTDRLKVGTDSFKADTDSFEADTDSFEAGINIVFQDVWFRYADSGPWVLSGINLDIKTGDSIVILGLSGGGKTTLIKLMLGLLIPVKGDIFIDGVNLQQIDLVQYRSHIGTVIPEDQLFAGPILENVAFFDPDLDQERVIDCLHNADLYEEITTMPMGMQTLVKDMSTTQKQKLLVARALYKRPEILIFDEAATHLDKDNPANVYAILRSTGKTHISITHREELLTLEDRVFILQDGKLIERLSSRQLPSDSQEET